MNNECKTNTDPATIFEDAEVPTPDWILFVFDSPADFFAEDFFCSPTVRKWREEK